MKKIFDFCKSNLSEILFALVSMFTLFIAAYSALVFNDVMAAFGIVFAVALQVFINTAVQKFVLSKPASQPCSAVWIVYFATLTLLLVGSFCFNRNLAILLGNIAVLIVAWLVWQFNIALQKANQEINQLLLKALEENSSLGNNFDILCLINNEKFRVPFEQRHIGIPIGVFPFADSADYIELTEYPNKKHIDKDVDEKRLLDVNFCERLVNFKCRLNMCLRALNSPIIEGIYLADNSYMHGCGWTVAFYADKDYIGSDYYGGSQPAKLRYMGTFEGKCQYLK